MKYVVLILTAFTGCWIQSAELLAQSVPYQSLSAHVSTRDVDQSAYVYEIDSRFNSITKRDSDGRIIWQLGSKGNLAGQFLQPVAINAQHMSRVYVLDASKGEIQAFSKDGEYLFTFGGKGSAAGQFLNPAAPLTVTDDRIIVCDSGNNRVQIFDLEGMPVDNINLQRQKSFGFHHC